MAARDNYRAQVELLIRCLPAVASEPDFALKGGTAINLFLRDMPRLSVDIDLTYLAVSGRDTALTGIRARLARIAEAIQRSVPGANVQVVNGDAPKLLVDKSGARIKVEPSVVIRGSLVPPIASQLCRPRRKPTNSSLRSSALTQVTSMPASFVPPWTDSTRAT
jgi:hypothetical protein